MFKNKKVLSVLILSALTMPYIFTLSKPASANIRPSAGSLDQIKSSCTSGPDQYQEITQLKNEIAAAGTVNQARAIALAPTDGAISALKSARAIMPLSKMTCVSPKPRLAHI